MTTEAPRPRVEPEFFERMYALDADPWHFGSSDYERAKYAHTTAALGRARFARALEVGCSIGVFTALLAERCDEVLAIDVSDRALALARERLQDRSGVALARAAFPEQMPDGPWDLVVCSEVLYYLDGAALTLAEQRLGHALEQGAVVLAVHWRPATRTYPWRGDDVHDRLIRTLKRWHTLDERRASYRLDRFDPR